MKTVTKRLLDTIQELIEIEVFQPNLNQQEVQPLERCYLLDLPPEITTHIITYLVTPVKEENSRYEFLSKLAGTCKPLLKLR
ncbi:hypothetical protein HK098_007414, partial [Nowakowskiella sp. JEL0407]